MGYEHFGLEACRGLHPINFDQVSTKLTSLATTFFSANTLLVQHSFFKVYLEEDEIIINTTGWTLYDSLIIRTREQNCLYPGPAVGIEGPFSCRLESRAQ